jgi:hypothetical protein
VAKLGEEQADDMAPCRERPGVFLLFELPRDLRRRVGRYELAKLGEYAELCLGWSFSFIHSPILGGIDGPATSFYQFFNYDLWDGYDHFL